MRDYNGNTKKWQASFFQEKEWLPLLVKDLTKIVLDPYQTQRHLRWKDIWRSTNVTLHWMPRGSLQHLCGGSRECLNTLRTTWSFSYLLQLGCFLYASWPHRPHLILPHDSFSEMPPPSLPFCKLSIILYFWRQPDVGGTAVFVGFYKTDLLDPQLLQNDYYSK